MSAAPVPEGQGDCQPPQRLDQNGPNGYPHWGPSYAYRGAVIHTNRRETYYLFELESFPNGGWAGLGSLWAVTRLVDTWLDEGRLPAHYRQRGPGAAQLPTAPPSLRTIAMMEGRGGIPSA
ncbi:hypothetical protein [Muricoccus aerilatus]|uniref:hypothetical protein n=1 Tax=Muricoccus aerilatus TaxID=452982 RepID=UPI0005C1B533|nr:hypothetical protein [Roseomonas aerilata]